MYSFQLHALAIDPERLHQLPDLLLHGEKVQDCPHLPPERLCQDEGAGK